MWERDIANFEKVSEAPVNMIFTLIKLKKIFIYLAALRLSVACRSLMHHVGPFIAVHRFSTCLVWA